MSDEKDLNSNEEKTTAYEKARKRYGSLIFYLEKRPGFEKAVERFERFVSLLEKFYVFEKIKRGFELTVSFLGKKSMFGFYVFLVLLFGLWLFYTFYEKLMVAIHSF